MNKKGKTVKRRSVAFTEEQLGKLDKLATKNNMSTSEVIRGFIDKGLSVESYSSEIDFIRKMIREECELILEPLLERLIKLIIKDMKVSAGGYYLLINMLSKVISDEFANSNEWNNIIESSNKLAIEYIKIKDINSLLQNAEELLKRAKTI